MHLVRQHPRRLRLIAVRLLQRFLDEPHLELPYELG
jgi:hypothetical protein